jgi:hypothetical protein
MLQRQPYVQYDNQSASKSVIFPPLRHASKIMLIYDPQQNKQLPGILVDILALANRCFLSAEVNQVPLNQYRTTFYPQTRFVAKSSTAPPNKFLILAAEVE